MDGFRRTEWFHTLQSEGEPQLMSIGIVLEKYCLIFVQTSTIQSQRFGSREAAQYSVDLGGRFSAQTQASPFR